MFTISIISFCLIYLILMIMSKKVIKSSNKNEKYNLKSVLDTDNIMSGVSLKAVTTIGCASMGVSL